MMIKLYSSQPWRNCCTSKHFRALLYSTEASDSSPSPQDTLFRMISRVGDPQVSIVGMLDQWVQGGRKIRKHDMKMLVKQLRKFRRFNHALQLFDWLHNERNQDLSTGDIAIRLHLISKVHGMEQAEEYFSSINEYSRDHKVYGALLNCYVEDKNLKKAEETMKKMMEAGYMKGPLSFNIMLDLYAQLGIYEKLDALVEKMKAMRIAHNRFTYTIQMNAYAATSDITNMEKILSKLEADPKFIMDWNIYYVVANGYLKAGLSEKSIIMLKKSEQLIGAKQRRSAYDYLITLYAAIGNRDEVYRVWDLYTNLTKRCNKGYLCILSSLMKLDDIEGAEKTLKEWESGDTCFDFRIPNLMISSYCMKGLVDKAEAYISRLMESGKEPPASTWDRLAAGYCASDQMMKAAEAFKKAISASKPGWKPTYHTLAACLKKLQRNGNVEVAEEISSLLREHNVVSVRRLWSRQNPNIRLDDQIEEDDHASDQNELDTSEVTDEETSDSM